MSKERIAGILIGISVGVAIGYYLRPANSDEAADGTARSRPKSEPAHSQAAPAPGPLAKAAAAG